MMESVSVKSLGSYGEDRSPVEFGQGKNVLIVLTVLERALFLLSSKLVLQET